MDRNLEMYKQKGLNDIYEENKLDLAKISVTDNNTHRSSTSVEIMSKQED